VYSFRFLLLRHGYTFLFGYILAMAAGLPIPGDPVLLVMGAMAGDRRYSFWISMLLAIVAALIGDYFWYELGRLRGRSILGTLCKLSLEPDTCVRTTEAAFTKHGERTLLLAKFVPGMSLVSMPLAGIIRMPRWRFLMIDAAGSALWTGAYLMAGRIFHREVDAVIDRLGLYGRRSGLIALALLALYLAFKYVQRWRFRRELRINRIAPEEALRLIESGHPLTVVDLRHPSQIKQSALKIAGAVILRPEDLRSRSHDIPPEHEVILYCT
jgi:membrane protein DedA with SNARE-associated domain